MSSSLLNPRPRRTRLKIYVHQQGKVLGPYNRDEIRRHLVNGEVSLSDPVWHDRLETWVALSDLPSSEQDGERYEMPSPPKAAEEPVRETASRPVRRRRERSAPPAPPQQKGWWARLFERPEPTQPVPARRRRESRRSNAAEPPFSRLAGAELCGLETTQSRELHLVCRSADGRTTVKVGGVRQLRVHQWTLGEVIESTTLYTDENVPREWLMRLERDETASRETITQRYGLAKSGWNLLHIVCRNGCQVFALLDRSAPPPRGASFDDDF